MKTFRMAIIFAAAGLFGLLVNDWIDTASPEPVVLIGVILSGVLFAIYFRAKESKP